PSRRATRAGIATRCWSRGSARRHASRGASPRLLRSTLAPREPPSGAPSGHADHGCLRIARFPSGAVRAIPFCARLLAALPVSVGTPWPAVLSVHVSRDRDPYARDDPHRPEAGDERRRGHALAVVGTIEPVGEAVLHRSAADLPQTVRPPALNVRFVIVIE